MLLQLAWDGVGFLSALIACVFILTRRRMLSGDHAAWHTAPRLVQAVLATQAIYMGCVALSILFGEHATQRETVAYVISAVVAVVFTVNLDKTGRRSAAGGEIRDERPGAERRA